MAKTKLNTEVVPRRSKSEISDPMQGEVGPNGYRVGYNEVGDKVEWLSPDLAVGVSDGKKFPMILRRGDKAISAACEEYREKVWWNSCWQSWLHGIETGEEPTTEENRLLLEGATKEAQRIERKYGDENLRARDDRELAIMIGRLSALAWVLGEEWDNSMDT